MNHSDKIQVMFTYRNTIELPHLIKTDAEYSLNIN